MSRFLLVWVWFSAAVVACFYRVWRVLLLYMLMWVILSNENFYVKQKILPQLNQSLIRVPITKAINQFIGKSCSEVLFVLAGVT